MNNNKINALFAYASLVSEEGIRTVSIEKMRSTRIDEVKHNLQFTKKGVIVGE